MRLQTRRPVGPTLTGHDIRAVNAQPECNHEETLGKLKTSSGLQRFNLQKLTILPWLCQGTALLAKAY